jgi:hypothetical protein
MRKLNVAFVINNLCYNMTGDLIVKFTVKLGFVTGYMHTDNAV